MYYPLYYTTNFFDNPDEIRQWAMSLSYDKTNGRYPGARTKVLHEIDINFFHFVHLKIMSLVYGKESEYVSWKAQSCFQLIKYEDIKEDNSAGWVHTDNSSALTSIIYLTPGKTNTGTNLYKPKKTGFQPDKDETFLKLIGDEKLNYYKSGMASENYRKKQLDFNNNFQKLVTVNSEYNSILCFDGGYYHNAEWDLKPGEERLTFITFFNKITAPSYPIPEMRRDCKK